MRYISSLVPENACQTRSFPAPVLEGLRSQLSFWLLVVPVLVLVGKSVACAADGLSEDVLTRLKNATVMVEVGDATGTGFVVQREADSALIATNAHVVASNVNNFWEHTSVVFGGGSTEERVLVADVLAVDVTSDLAILKVSARDLPEPVDIDFPVEIRETLSVYILGYPYGESLATKGNHPAITVAEGNVASFRRDSENRVELVQIDGSINPGSSGGPVVDAAGHLIGVATAKVKGTQIGFAIPTETLTSVLRGNVSEIDISGRKINRDQCQLSIQLQTIDPKDNIQSVKLMTVDKQGVESELENAIANRLIEWPQLSPTMAESQLKLGSKNSQRVTVAAPNAALVYQIKMLRRDGGISWTRPMVLEILETPPKKTPVAMAIDAPEIKPVEMNNTGKTIALPGPVKDIVVGGGGRFLVMHFETLQKLAVFDVSELKIVTYFPVDDQQVFFAAGAEHVVALMAEKNTITRWSLKTFERELTKLVPIPYEATTFSMGAASGGPILIGSARGSSVSSVDFFDLRTLEQIELDKAPDRADMHRGTQVRASADGSVFGVWRTSVSPSGIKALHFNGNEVTEYYEHDSAGYVVPNSNGTVLFTANGLFTNQVEAVASSIRRQANLAVPAVHGDYYLSIGIPEGSRQGEAKQPRVFLCRIDQKTPLVMLPAIPLHLVDGDIWSRDPMTIDKRVFLIPRAEVILTLVETRDKLEAVRFDLDATLDSSGLDYLFIHSVPPKFISAGEVLEYQLEVKSKRGGVRYSLESGPDGMTLTKDGFIRWETDLESAPEKQTIIVSLSDDSGQSIFHTFVLQVRK
ncbi:S1 family peptidase [Aureliella helgolandensis]|uniref:Serine protease HhoB n=1 Tax=Aureliella helgolandensis TaxID=2527968 RepID=A0A518G446_9BACT|nr:serine protease [Aureliella helgolandensis]QDV23373.1 Putative serine protease HhoB precursor [Aureliella helgolandensis]